VEWREGRDEIREGREEGRVRGVRRGGKGQRERGHEGAWSTPKAPAAAPPLQKSWSHYCSQIVAFGGS